MKRKFNNLNELFEFIKDNMEDIMKNDVAEAVKDEEQRQISRVVYDVYTPNNGEPYEYVRRKWKDNSGGLADREVIVATIGKTKDGVILSVINTARGSDQEDLYLAPLVEYGHDNGYGEYQYPYNRDNTAWKFLQSRPFTEETIKALKRSGLHVEVMKQELNRRGIKTK